MGERGISEADVLRVLNDPDHTYPSYGKQVAEDVFETSFKIDQTGPTVRPKYL
jgi:hypothetical protein